MQADRFRRAYTPRYTPPEHDLRLPVPTASNSSSSDPSSSSISERDHSDNANDYVKLEKPETPEKPKKPEDPQSRRPTVAGGYRSPPPGVEDSLLRQDTGEDRSAWAWASGPAALATEFWRTVEAAGAPGYNVQANPGRSGKHSATPQTVALMVEYGSDLDTEAVGSAFPGLRDPDVVELLRRRAQGQELTPAEREVLRYAEDPWNPQNLANVVSLRIRVCVSECVCVC